MLPHQTRVVEEKKELDTKLKALNAFLQGEKVKELSEVDHCLLVQQSGAMEEYSNILAKRIAVFPKEV